MTDELQITGPCEQLEYCVTFGFDVHEDELAKAICQATGKRYTHITLEQSYLHYRNKEGTLFKIRPIAVRRTNSRDGVLVHTIDSGKVEITSNLLEVVEKILEARQ